MAPRSRPSAPRQQAISEPSRTSGTAIACCTRQPRACLLRGHPHLHRMGTRATEPGAGAAAIRMQARSGGESREKAPFRSAVPHFYRPIRIARASAVVDECLELAEGITALTAMKLQE